MNQKKSNYSALDIILWLLIALLIAGSIWANYHFSAVDISLRLIGWLVLAIVVLGIALLTRQGKIALQFTKESRTELRKVVWPNRQETFRTTMMVIVMVILLALIIWGIDTIFFHIVGWLTAQRG